MYRHPDCEKYRLWKREQSKKLKKRKKPKKAKDRKPTADCIEDEKNDEEIEKTLLKVSYRKCREKKKAIKKNGMSKQRLKKVSLTDLILKRIQPSIEEREKFINQRHLTCLYEDASRSVPAAVESLPPRFPSRDASGKKARKGSRRRKTKDRHTEKQEDTMDDTQKVTTGKDKINRGKNNGKKAQKKKRKKLQKKGIEKTSDTQASDSVCSLDSEICVAGLALTPEDKRKLKDYRRQSNTSG